MKDLREAYLAIYENQLDERMDPEERALRRAEVADKKASRMDAKVASKYAGSEARSAEREDKKSKGKHIHGMADSVELDGDLVDEGTMDIKGFEIPQKERESAKERIIAKTKEIRNKKKIRESSEKVDEAVYGGEKKEPKDDRMVVTNADKKANTKAYQNYKAGHKGYRAANHLGERALDPTETAEKERIVKGMKKSAAGFKERYGKRAKEVMYATATARAKERMDTSKSDRRYGVER